MSIDCLVSPHPIVRKQTSAVTIALRTNAATVSNPLLTFHNRLVLLGRKSLRGCVLMAYLLELVYEYSCSIQRHTTRVGLLSLHSIRIPPTCDDRSSRAVDLCAESFVQFGAFYEHPTP